MVMTTSLCARPSSGRGSRTDADDQRRGRSGQRATAQVISRQHNWPIMGRHHAQTDRSDLLLLLPLPRSLPNPPLNALEPSASPWFVLICRNDHAVEGCAVATTVVAAAETVHLAHPDAHVASELHQALKPGLKLRSGMRWPWFSRMREYAETAEQRLAHRLDAGSSEAKLRLPSFHC